MQRHSHRLRRDDPETARFARIAVLGSVALIAITFVAYVPALKGDFIWDDDDYVTQNPTLRNLDGLRRIWFEFGATRQYYPLVYSTFWFEYHVWNLHPAGYHAVNILLHGVGAALLWRILRRLHVPGAFVAAAIFAIHPVHVESVAWITERKNVLSGMFYFAALLAYLRGAGFALADTSRATPTHSKSTGTNSIFWRAYAVSLVFFILALMSKSVTCSLPAVILVILWWKRGRLRAADFVPLIPMFILGIIFGLITANLETSHVGAGGAEWARPFSARMLTAGRAFWFYLDTLFWPHALIFVYPKWDVKSSDAAAYVYPAAIVLLFTFLYKLRKTIGRGPLTAMLFFGGTLAPALGFFNVYYALRYSPVADHFQYLASVGPIVLTVAATYFAAKRINTAAFQGLAAAAILLLGYLTWDQCRVYRDLQSLWTDTIAKNPSAGVAHMNLGTIYQKRGEYEVAAQSYRRALSLDPPDAKVLFNLGTVLQHLGQTDEAIAQYEASLALQSDYPKCLVNLAEAIKSKGQLDRAISYLSRAVELQPDYALAHANLAAVLEQAGKIDEAARHYREAIRLNPRDETSIHRLRALGSRVNP